MMHSPNTVAEHRRMEALRNAQWESSPGDGAAFAEWLAPLQASGNGPGSADAYALTGVVGDGGNPSAIRQANGAPSKNEQAQLEADAAESAQSEDASAGDDDNDKSNDNSLLASIMASCTTREKPKIYLDCEHAGLPLRELDRMARALHDSAIAGRPKLSLGIVLPELGEIRFDVQISGKVVFIHAFVENERAASALALAVSALRDRLEEQRLILGRLDVTSPGGKNQDGRRPGERPISGHRRNPARGESSPGFQTDEEEGIHVLA